jgi:hypothetical protein
MAKKFSQLDTTSGSTATGMRGFLSLVAQRPGELRWADVVAKGEAGT